MEISYNKIKELAKMSKDNVVVFQLKNGELQILFFSANVAALFGYSEKEFARVKKEDAFLFDYENGNDADKLKKELLGIINTDIVYNISLYLKHKCGEYVKASGDVTYIGKNDSYPTFYVILNDETGISRNQSLQKTIQNEQKLQNIIEFTKIYVWDYDINTHTIFNDNGWKKKFGINLETLTLPDSFIDAGYIDDDINDFIDAFKTLNESGREITHETWMKFPSQQSPMCIKAIYHMDPNDPFLFHAIGLDITEQKNAETTFKTQLNAIQKLSENTLATIHFNLSQNKQISSIITNTDLRKIADSKTIEDFITGYIQFLPEKEERNRLINKFSKGNLLSSYNTGYFNIETKHHLALGNHFTEWAKVQCNLLANPHSGDIEAIIQIQNIHEFELTEMLVNGTVRNNFSFIALCDIPTKRCLILENKFGYDKPFQRDNYYEEFNLRLSDIIESQEELERVLNDITDTRIIAKLKETKNYIIEFNSSQNDSNFKRFQLNISYQNPEKKTIFLITCRNITESYLEQEKQKQILEDALQSAQKANNAKSEFLSLVSHDIRTPLNGIMGMTGLAMEEEISDKARYYLGKSTTSAQFLQGLINDILDINRIESGKFSFSPTLYSQKEFFNYLDAVIVPLCQKKNIYFRIKTGGYDGYINVDKMRFNQIFFNLLSNSVKYSYDNSTINFNFFHEIIDTNKVRGTFEIIDQGIGMSKEFQEHLFEPFTQENRINNFTNLGSGLGLTIVQKLILAMNGTISVESKINHGTKFTITMEYPYETKKEVLNKHLDPNADIDFSVFKDKNVLVCEDNEINMEIAKEVLSHLGVNVFTAVNGWEGVQEYEKRRPYFYDLILMDIRMPKLNGIEATKLIRTSTKSDSLTIPIVAMTANAMDEDRTECLNNGMDAFLTKPININEINATLYGFFKNKK